MSAFRDLLRNSHSGFTTVRMLHHPNIIWSFFLGIRNVTDSGRLDLSNIRHIPEQDYPEMDASSHSSGK